MVTTEQERETMRKYNHDRTANGDSDDFRTTIIVNKVAYMKIKMHCIKNGMSFTKFAKKAIEDYIMREEYLQSDEERKRVFNAL